MDLSDATVPRIAVIGGGVAGLTCARALHGHGLDVTIFDKARKPGGRMSTRRLATDLVFDHGAQYFTIRDPWFSRALAPLVSAGVIARWSGRLAVCGATGIDEAGSSTERWVGVPTMSAIPRFWSQGLPVVAQTRIVSLFRRANHWGLRAEDTRQWDHFDRVVVSIPSGQAATLVSDIPSLHSIAEQAAMDPCWAVMVELRGEDVVPYDAAFIEDSPLVWAMRQSSKRDRPAAEAWVLHASPSWTRTHWDDRPKAIINALMDAWSARGGPPRPGPRRVVAHRWRYARPRATLRSSSAGDAEAGVVLAGDWLEGGRVEGAFTSGRTAAAAVLRSLHRLR